MTRTSSVGQEVVLHLNLPDTNILNGCHPIENNINESGSTFEYFHRLPSTILSYKNRGKNTGFLSH